jgi:hypothetical protein
MTDEAPPHRYKPEVKAFLLHTRRMVEEAGATLRTLLDRGDIPEPAYLEAWHALEAAGEALAEAQPPGWEPGRSAGTIPPLPPMRRDRGLIR